MAQIKEEDKKELRFLTKDLVDISCNLRNLHKQATLRLILSYLYELIWAILIKLSLEYYLLDDFVIYFFVVNIVFFTILSLYFSLLVRRLIAMYEQRYYKGLNKLAKLVNFVDWDVYRKHQLYNDNIPEVENAVKEFFLISRTMITPTSSKNKLFKFFEYTCVIIRYVLLFISLYVAYKSIYHI